MRLAIQSTKYKAGHPKEGQTNLGLITAQVEDVQFNDAMTLITSDYSPSEPCDKLSVPTFLPYTFDETDRLSSDGQTYKVLWRNSAKVNSLVTAIVLDIDNDQQELDNEHNTIGELPHVDFDTLDNFTYRYFAYTSASHTPIKNKFRVVMDISRPITFEEYNQITMWLNWFYFGKQCDARMTVSPQCAFVAPYGSEIKSNLCGVVFDVDSFFECEYQEFLKSRDLYSAIGYMEAGLTKTSKTRKPKSQQELEKVTDALSRTGTVLEVSMTDPLYSNQILQARYACDDGNNHYDKMLKCLVSFWLMHYDENISFEDVLNYANQLKKLHPRFKVHGGFKQGDEVLKTMISDVITNNVPVSDLILSNSNTNIRLVYREGECGQGKTYEMLDRIAKSTKDKTNVFIFATLKRLDHDERSNEFLKALARNGIDTTEWTIEKVRSRADNEKEKFDESVRVRLNNLRQLINDKKTCNNVLIFTTHIGMLYNDWQYWSHLNPSLIIDEAPECTKTWARDYAFHTSIVTDALEIGEIDGECFELIPTTKGVAQYENNQFDNANAGLRQVLDLAIKPATKLWVTKESWDSFCDDNKDQEKRVLSFFSLLDPHIFLPFKNVTFMADEFSKSDVFRSFQTKWGVKWIRDTKFDDYAKKNRVRTTPLSERVKIHYFADECSREASISLFDEAESPLRYAFDYINSHTYMPFLYTTNTAFSKLYQINNMNSEAITPKSHGMNGKQEYLNCFWVCAMRPNGFESKMIRDTIGMTPDEVRYWRERNPLYQFVMRTNLRDYNSDKMVNIYVFDYSQATYLADRFGVEYSELVHIDVIPEHILRRKKTGRKTIAGAALSSGDRAKKSKVKKMLIDGGINEDIAEKEALDAVIAKRKPKEVMAMMDRIRKRIID